MIETVIITLLIANVVLTIIGMQHDIDARKVYEAYIKALEKRIALDEEHMQLIMRELGNCTGE